MSGFVLELARVGLYKRTQGKITRQVTAAALFVAIALGCWQLSVIFKTWPWLQARAPGMEYGIPGVLLALGAWLCYRLVNYAPFADFLIAVEAEMAKVSWPSRRELVRATVVVLVSMLVLTIMLYVYDTVWWLALYKLLNISGTSFQASEVVQAQCSSVFVQAQSLSRHKCSSCRDWDGLNWGEVA